MTTGTLKALGAKIRRLRKQNRLSQETLSSMLDIDRGYISEIERGQRNPSIGVIEKIAHGLEVSLVQLFEEEEESASSQI